MKLGYSSSTTAANWYGDRCFMALICFKLIYHIVCQVLFSLCLTNESFFVFLYMLHYAQIPGDFAVPVMLEPLSFPFLARL